MRSPRTWNRKIWWHLLAWVAGYLAASLDLIRGGQVYRLAADTLWLPNAVWTLANATLFYANTLWLMPRRLRTGGWWAYLPALLPVLLVVSLVEVYTVYAFHDYYALRPPRRFWFALHQEVVHNLIIVFLAFTYRYVQELMARQRTEHERAQQQLTAELQFLKAQVNPHFLFNTLNNIFAQARQEQAPTTARSVAKLAHMMRYQLYESNVPLVEAERELQYIRDFIELQQMRFAADQAVRISLDEAGPLAAVQLPPMLLLPFVENAFKHGVSLRQASFIAIELSAAEPGQLRFSVRNSLAPRTHESLPTAGGIGLENVRRRLALLYPGRHELQVKAAPDTFSICLTLDLAP
ncbi:sensor histidine kinase [Hymenobacter cellulosivorans]|uniref:Histidine kinase n=1 Tax=Hymenobacter cellulosivorans TaxID=2932249 RepID=A0ABY4F5U3_9BACT|nr:histidine kinase [Hymenobacter cellulosivorans]UOQ52042.1 histidine kinase [Hymenobacter cellulosivorans]